MLKLNERTRADLAEVQKIVSRTGLNLDTLLPKDTPRPSRAGGIVSSRRRSTGITAVSGASPSSCRR